MEYTDPVGTAKGQGEFAGTDRFLIHTRLGKGGMGVVYRAYDRERRMNVALKTLLKVEPGTIYRFKKEFRALVDVAHPNLVSLYELVSDRDTWFFTMELLDGVDFLSYVRGDAPADAEHTASLGLSELGVAKPAGGSSVATLATRDVKTPNRTDGEDEPPPLDWDRLRAALGQLAQGVHALHESGHLHRDIKPSNVLVTAEDRVVLLDFGVITELAGARHHGGKTELVGTPAYMAPEQARGEVTRASDWYSVGVMLYDALCGRRPFSGSSESVLREKQRAEAPPPQLARPDVPEDLNRLCVDLLRREPESRPSGPQVLQRLGVDVDTRSGSSEPLRSVPEPEREAKSELVGRERHLGALHAAYDATKRGHGETVLIHGSSGMGKTALVNHFLEEVAFDQQAVILTGRCYEREQVPYKAVDSVIDAMCRYLLSLSEHEVDAFTPRDVLMLAKVFPVLKRVEVFARARRRVVEAPDPHEVRRRAFAALRDLVGRIAERRPLVIFIDDAQWGDADSAPLLDELMRPPDAPSLLLLLSYRSDDTERSPLLSSLLARDGRLATSASTQRLEVGPLDTEDAGQLAVALLEGVKGGAETALAVARESHGHPYFIHELARHAREQGIDDATELSLEAAISGRIDRLTDDARRLMTAVAVAGRPIAQGILGRAAELDPAERAALIHQLRAAQLVRSSGARDDDMIESYHDRIRQTVLGRLDDDATAQLHRKLAHAYQASAQPDAETLVMHFFAAGESEAAAEYAIEAAGKAEAALSFDRAAQLYRLALELRSNTEEEERDLKARLAEATYNAGRGPEAALCFVDASELATGMAAVELRRRAAEQYLRSGYLEEGIALVRDVLRVVGLRYPKTPLRSIVGLLFRRLQLRLRGLRFRERSPDEMSPKDLMSIDVCWSVATGLSQIEAPRAGVFCTRMLLLALKLGDSYRAARAMMLEACFQATMGSKSRRRTSQLFEHATRLVEAENDPKLAATAQGISGFISFEQGSFSTGHERCEQGLELLLAQPGMAWEVGTMQLFSLVCLTFMGEFNEIRRLAPERVASAQQRGDLYTVTNIRCVVHPSLWMAEGRPDEAIREIEDAIARWGGIERGYHNQHFMAMIMKAQADLQRGDARSAYQRWLDDERPLKRSFLLFVQIIRGYYSYGRAVAGLAAAVNQTGQIDLKSALKQADRDARWLERQRLAWTIGMGKLVRAVSAAARRDREDVVEQLRLAVAEFEEANMWAHVATCRRALGRLLGGSEGERLVRFSDDYGRDKGAKDMDTFGSAIAPLLFDL